MSLAPPARLSVVPRPMNEALKRLIDLVGAGLGLVAGAPLLGLAAIATHLHDGGSPWFAQVRVGQDGRRFVLYKLRTMVEDAEHQKAKLRSRNEVHGVAFKIEQDPRVTPLGHWLRRTSLDELPQLLNVLRGEMSLVGPRPALPEEVAAYTPEQRARLMVKPGLTGLWQVSGRAALPFEQWIPLDLQYVTQRSLTLDLWLLMRTVPAVLIGRGAF
ncbi:MAG: sugar transferase [Myxococcota bacterium]